MRLLSIITPTLNSIKTIKRNLESVSMQGFDNYEHIIIDGHSIDGTRNFIKNYDGHKIIFLDEEEKGIYQAINQGIKEANGKYIMLLNSDDWLNDSAMKIIAKKITLSKKNIHIFISDVYEESIKISQVHFMKNFDLPIQKMPFSHGAMIAKKNFLIRKGMYSKNFKLSSDLDFIHKTKKDDYEYHFDSIHCFSLEGISSQSYEGLRESMEIAINYGKSSNLARLFFIKVIFNKFLGKLFGFKNLIKLKRLVRYSSNWE